MSRPAPAANASADPVSQWRDGAVVGELASGAIEHDAMIRMMIGRDLKSLHIPAARPPGDAVLEIAGLRTSAHASHALDLTLRAALIRLVRVDSETIRPSQIFSIRSSLLTTRSRFSTR